MYGGKLQQKIQYGYGKCAQFIGAPFILYRSSTPINPLSQSNIAGIILSSANVSWDYMTQQKYGKAVWNLIIETRLTTPIHAQPGDFLVPTAGYYFKNPGLNNSYNPGFGGFNDSLSPSAYGGDLIPFKNGFIEDSNIYYVASTEFLLPILGVSCNRTISIIRPTQTIGAGFQGYAEYLTDTSLTIVSGMPASILELSTDGMAPSKLPTDTNEPRWIILIPNLGNVTIRVDDIVIDDLNQEYVITDNELTYLGWRILAEQVVNSR